MNFRNRYHHCFICGKDVYGKSQLSLHINEHLKDAKQKQRS
jgi:hypothetical protein